MGFIESLIGFLAPVFKKLFGLLIGNIVDAIVKIADKLGDWIIDSVSSTLRNSYKSSETKVREIMYKITKDRNYVDINSPYYYTN